MSYAIKAYAVDVDKLKALFGSYDNNFLTILKFELSDEISAFNNSLASGTIGGSPKIEEFVSFIIRNDFVHKGTNNAEYAYALELICQSLGTKLVTNALTRTDYSRYRSLPEICDLGVSKGFLDGLLPLPNGIPGVGCIHNSELEYRYLMATQLFSVHGEHNVKRFYHEYIGWLIEAKKDNAGLVTFLY